MKNRQSHHVQLPWGALHYLDSQPLSGDTGTLLLLHGTGCAADDWQPVLDAWPHETTALPRIVIAEFRGHGASTVPARLFSISDLARDVVALIEHLNLRSVGVVGHSLGGMVALEAATLCPAISSLLLLEGWRRLDLMGHFDSTHMFGHLPPVEVEAIKHRAARVRERFAPAVWQAFWRTVEEFDGTAALATLEIPIAVVYGRAGWNPQTPPEILAPLRDNIIRVWVEDAGHYLPLEAPGEVAALAARLLV